MQILAYIPVILLGYLLGTPNLTYFLARRAGVDLAEGTGNPGASNALIFLGWRAFVLTAANDVGKAVVAVRLSRVLFPAVALSGIVSGVACVLGHVFPFYLHFRGGKGIAAYLGVALSLDWRFAVIAFTAAVLVGLVTYPVVGSNLAALCVPVYFTLRLGLAAGMVLSVAAILIVVRHQANYSRIRSGEERRYLESGSETGETRDRE